MRWRAFVAAGVLALFSAVVAACSTLVSGEDPEARPDMSRSERAQPRSARYFVHGRVIDVDGRGVEASVRAGTTTVRSARDGSFAVRVDTRRVFLDVTAPGYVRRVRAAAAGSPTRIRLTPDPDGDVVSMHFVGDMMFGRRFLDPAENGYPFAGRLELDDSAAAHAALFDGVQPLLRAADVTAGNLESVLSDHDFIDPAEGSPMEASRPLPFHATKDYVFASSPESAAALRHAGFDVIDIGNNHLFDLLDRGVDDTLKALEGAGFRQGQGWFGAGPNRAVAEAPARWTDGTASVSFAGCTSITGDEHPVTYVADEAKGGAARCSHEAVRSQMTAANRVADATVYMVHGGYEYGRDPTPNVRALTRTALEAGARLVVNHHPHVVGGIDWDGRSLVAWSLGNFLFDQQVWPTFESYLLAVHLRAGRVVRAYAEPLMLAGFRPVAVVGEQRDWVARRLAARSPGAVVDDGAIEVVVGGRHTDTHLHPPAGRHELVRLGAGWRVAEEPSVRAGRDLLWVGNVDDETVDPTTTAGVFWTLGEDDAGVTTTQHGGSELLIEVEAGHPGDPTLGLRHRVVLGSRRELSLAGRIAGEVPEGSTVQLSWYRDTKGRSDARTVVPLSDARVRLDAVAPDWAVAAGIFVKVPPPARGVARVRLDDLRLIEWSPGTPEASDDFVLLAPGTPLSLVREVLPGGRDHPPVIDAGGAEEFRAVPGPSGDQTRRAERKPRA